MEPRRPLHQPADREGRLVPYRAGEQLLRIPLLPYERDLIATLGCSEEDYRRFTAEAQRRAAVRPAEYALIPDIQNEATFWSIVISLAVGAVLQGVSYLLTPKPKAPGQVQQRRLGDITGADRFSVTSGFDNQAELANYGDPIPIIFGQYTGETGGILAAPKLVWSRAFSYGSQQGVKLMFVVGEQGLGEGLDTPAINGIFLGNTGLDVIYGHNFAFYWKRNTNKFYRIRAQNLAYGTRGTPSSGDTQTEDDAFVCTTIEGQSQPGFCQVYTPSANVQFGAYSAIPNGTDYRVNWRLVPIPNIPGVDNRSQDDRKDQKLYERIKIAGDYGLFEGSGNDLNIQLRDEAQRGTGRGYGRRMGITRLNNVPVTSGETNVRQVNPNDTIEFTIAPGELPEDLYYVNYGEIQGTKIDDINNEIVSGRQAADEMLQLGETIMIGRTVWVVESRSLPQWTENERQRIGLRCIEIFGEGIGASIGLISEKMLTRGVYSDDLGTTNARNGLGLHAGGGFYPLLRVAFGVVRNSRDCEVTELGIRSQVWNRANGLCNFSALPTPEAFRQAEKDSIAIESGAMTLYMKRTSVWTIWLRPSGTDSNGIEYKWQPLGEQFCVTGETPQDQFNFIRITHPQRERYEFKLVPKSGADVARHSPDSAVFWRLDAKTRQPLAGTYSTPYGDFKVYSIGTLVTKGEVAFNSEMISEPKIVQPERTVTIPSAIEVDTYLPDEEDAGAKPTGLQLFDWLPDGVTEGRKAATMYELFGRADYMGLVRTARRTFVIPSGINYSITVEFTGIVNENFPLNHPYFPGYRAWNFQSITVISASGSFETGQIIQGVIPVTPGNPRAQPYGLTTCGVKLQVTATTAGRPRGRKAAYGYEVFGSAESLSVGTQATQNFVVGTIKAIAFEVSAAVVDASDEIKRDFPNVTKIWDNFNFRTLPNGTSQSWQQGDFINQSVPLSNSNPFQVENRTVAGVRLRVLQLATQIAPPVLSPARFFEQNSQLNDISFYGSLLSKSNESNPEHEIVYVNESVSNSVAPEYEKLSLCGLALKASRNFTSINQLRTWLPNGISVQRFQADAPEPIGPSNKFTDLVYYLLTDKTAGAGNVIAPELIDADSLPATSQFLEQNKLFFDGAIEQPSNVRQFISELAPFFLCNFVISNGRFSVVPALPTSASGAVSNKPVKIKQLFTSGNIIEDSFNLEYLSTEERKNFQAVMRYRQERRNQFPEEHTLAVRWADMPESETVETFDMTQYCTSRHHAFTVAKYFLSLRSRVTHTVNFKTTPYGMDLAPGDYIRIVTEATPYNAANNGVVDADGDITAVTALDDGTYTVFYWNANFDDPTTDVMTVASGKAIEPKFYNSVFTVEDASVSSSTYMVEQLTLDEDGLVNIVAAHFPTTSELNSIIALDVLNDAAFVTEE